MSIEKIHKERSQLIGLQKFSKRLNKPPEKGQIKENPRANNSKYLPISYVEMALDELFFGLWETRNFKHEVIVNEIVGSIELSVYHPVAQIWITRTGLGSTPIQMVKGSELGPDMIYKKIHTTLVKDYPHLKAECVKNAARSLGKAFGRDLNRLFEDEYVPLIKMPENDPMTIGQAAYIDSLLYYCTLSEKELKRIEHEAPNYTFNEASLCIEHLQANQKEREITQDINRPKHLGDTEATIAYKEKLYRDK